MKKILLFALCLSLIQNTAFSQTVYDDNYQENPNYLQGNKYYENSQYSSAINEYKKALRSNPSDTSSLIGLTNSYNSRAQYYNNTIKATDNAISDLKSALFFLKYFNDNISSFTSANSILATEKNLKLLESSQKQSITNNDRLISAKKSRIKGEFAAAAYDYYQLLNTDKSFEANAALGDIYKLFNRPEKAVIFYKKALAINSDNTDIHLKLARTYEQLNDFESSLKEYDFALATSSERDDILTSLERIWQKKVDTNPKDAEAHANLGVVFQKEKRYNEALAEYQKAEALNPTNINTKINIGTLYQEQNRYDQAINTYDAILKLQPYNSKVIIYKAQCMKALNRNDNAVELYKTALNLEPNNAQIKAELFDLLKEKMPTEQVLDFLYKNVQNAPMNANAYYEFAYELHKANKIDDAIVYYKETIKLDNKKTDAYINLSQAYRQKKNYTEAFNVIKKAKEIAPDNKQVQAQYDTVAQELTSIQYTAATNAFQSGDYHKAIEEYKKVVPETLDSNLGIAASYQALSNNTEAINYYKKAMLLDSKNADIPFYIASLYIKTNDFVNAKQYLNKVIAISPEHKQAKEFLQYIKDKETDDLLTNAVSLYDSQKYNETVTLLNKVIASNPQNATAYYYRALSYEGLSNYQNAIADYKNTLKYAPDMLISYYMLGVAYDSLNNYQAAKENYKKYVELSTEDNDYRQYAQKRIQEIQ